MWSENDVQEPKGTNFNECCILCREEIDWETKHYRIHDECWEDAKGDIEIMLIELSAHWGISYRQTCELLDSYFEEEKRTDIERRERICREQRR